MFFKPGQHKEMGLRYSPLKALIAPRPIGWISTLSKEGVANLAPYSFFNGVSELPPMVMFASAPDRRDDNVHGQKDSLANILETGGFGVNIVSAALANQMMESSKPLPAERDEFKAAGLTKKQGEIVDIPLVAEAPAHLECRYYSHITLPDYQTGDGTIQGTVMVIGEIVGIHIDPAFIEDGRLDVTKYQPVARLGYGDYAMVSDLFEMWHSG
ncbi:MAG: flavin reductase family protein [Candidatus Puniceispirillaceae bacterium]